MTFNYSIADALRAKREPIPAEIYFFVDPSEIEVRTAKPKWTWVARACHEIPIGKAILLPLPDEYKGQVERFMNNVRSALSVGHRVTKYDKFSVRRSKHEDYVVVMKSGTWETVYREMEAA